jgi:hypothetical protein
LPWIWCLWQFEKEIGPDSIKRQKAIQGIEVYACFHFELTIYKKNKEWMWGIGFLFYLTLTLPDFP